MVRVGLVGIGFMGQQHFAIYPNIANAELVAVCDKIPERVAEKAASIGGNLGEAAELDLSPFKRYTSFDEMLASEELDVIDLCTPTHVHAEMAIQALEAGKNVICEKPMARSVAECESMIAAAKANNKLLFIAQCIRFWPEYEVLSKMVADGELGDIISARFTRQSPKPTWASEGWLMNNDFSGGAMLDLHIHDVDYILSIFGKPQRIVCQAQNLISTGDKVDHVVTSYLYDDFTCVAEGGWIMPDSFPFEMGFQVLGSKGILEFTGAKDPALRFYPFDGEPVTPEYKAGTGYERELPYFIDCVENAEEPKRVTAESAKESVAMVLAEFEAARCGGVYDIC